MPSLKLALSNTYCLLPVKKWGNKIPGNLCFTDEMLVWHDNTRHDRDDMLEYWWWTFIGRSNIYVLSIMVFTAEPKYSEKRSTPARRNYQLYGRCVPRKQNGILWYLLFAYHFMDKYSAYMYLDYWWATQWTIFSLVVFFYILCITIFHLAQFLRKDNFTTCLQQVLWYHRRRKKLVLIMKWLHYNNLPISIGGSSIFHPPPSLTTNKHACK